MKRFRFILLLSIIVSCATSIATKQAIAIPEFSLLTGTKCSACHFDPQGSGIRTELGWSMMSGTGLWQWKRPATSTTDQALQALSDEPDYPVRTTWAAGKLVPGFDARLQLARSTHTGNEVLIPMQFSTSLAYIPSRKLNIYTNVNLASIEERIRGGNLFPGQTDFDAALQYEPSPKLPSVRIGMIQPSFGTRYDDHTAYVRREAALTGGYLLPAYYNDLGAEFTYEGVPWITLNFGVFGARNLTEIDPTLGTRSSEFDFSKPTISARAILWQQSLTAGINTQFGASAMQNGDFQMADAFAGFGLADKATFLAETMVGTNADDRQIRNYSIDGSYKLYEWLTAHWRYDWGHTTYPTPGPSGYAAGFLFGFEFFPLPDVELRPEFRSSHDQILGADPTYSDEFTVQLHLFY